MKKKDVERIIALYMTALGNEKLSLKCWKKIAKVNSILLNKII